MKARWVLLVLCVAGCGGESPSDETAPAEVLDAVDIAREASTDTPSPLDKTPEASGGGPCVEIAPDPVDLAVPEVGVVATRTLTLTSCADTAFQITKVAFAEGSSPFLHIYPDTAWRYPTPDDPVSLFPGQAWSIQVAYEPEAENEVDETGDLIPHTGILELRSGTVPEPWTVGVQGVVTPAACPVAVIQVAEGNEVVTPIVLHLYGEQSFVSGGAIEKWEWSVEKPLSSGSVFIPSNTWANPTFEVDNAGTYRFGLKVWSDQGVPSCTPTIFTVTAFSDEAIHVELRWHTPGDPNETDTGKGNGTDLDLHFLHPLAGGPDIDGDGQPDGWYDQPFDCFWFNAYPEWGEFDPSVDDNPGLSLDDDDGAGPEIVDLHLPEDVTYKVGVHYWEDWDYGDSYATVRVYSFEELVFEASDVLLSELDLWEVCTIDWVTGEVAPVLDEEGDLKITPQYENPYFVHDDE